MAYGYSCRTSKWSNRSGLVRATLATLFTFALARPTAASVTSQWALQYLHADQIWKTTRGAGVEVAVIDTGVQPNADLSTNLRDGADFSNMGEQSIGDGRTDTDSYGHGTGEASLIAGSGSATQGLAPATAILPVRASDGAGSELTFSTAPAIEYAIAHGASVVNIAFTLSLDSHEIREAVDDALSHNIVVVAAVGNFGTAQQYYPAAWPGVIGVGAIDSSGKVWERSNTGADVALVAPGVHILRDDNRGRVGYSDGTSEATAYVSAAAALVRSAHPGWSASEVVAALEETADKPAAMGGAVRDDRYGAGILDVLAAVRLAEPPVVGGAAGGAVAPMRKAAGGGWGWLFGAGGAAVVGGLIVFRTRRRVRRRA